MKHRSKKGFTLIELLVVIGIIMVLASILTPALLRAREQANRATCLSNMRSVGQAMQIYANENDDYYPIIDPAADTTVDIFSRLYHKKNFNNTKVFICPNKKRYQPPTYDNATNSLVLAARSHLSYAVVLSWDQTGETTADGAAGAVTPMTTDPGDNILLLEDPEGDLGGGESLLYDDYDNHGTDGTNLYTISGQARWFRGKVASGDNDDYTILPGPNKDIHGVDDVSLDGTTTDYGDAVNAEVLVIREDGLID